MVRPGNRSRRLAAPNPLDLRQFLPEDLGSDPLAEIADVSDDERAELVARAAKLSVDLLTLPLEEGDLPE
jgi:hypothetical protein